MSVTIDFGKTSHFCLGDIRIIMLLKTRDAGMIMIRIEHNIYWSSLPYMIWCSHMYLESVKQQTIVIKSVPMHTGINKDASPTGNCKCNVCFSYKTQEHVSVGKSDQHKKENHEETYTHLLMLMFHPCACAWIGRCTGRVRGGKSL